MAFLSKFFGDPNKKEVGRYQSVIDEINAFEPDLEKKTDAQIREEIGVLRTEISRSSQDILEKTLNVLDANEQLKERRKQINELLKPYLPKVFAITREAAKRAAGMRHYDVQLVGGTVLHQGQIAEMRTGEGKTLVATLPLVLNALTGLGAHLVTVNDYLARRDAGWMAEIYDFLGLSVGVIGPQFSFVYDRTHTNDEHDHRLRHLRPVSRQEAYRADITYGTNNEFGFDYLRDNMVNNPAQMSQRELAYAIVDEVDSILIDEARTPLIISAPSSESAHYYQEFAQHMPKFKIDRDFTVDEKARSASLTDEGIRKLEGFIGVQNLYDPNNVGLAHYADVALKAHALYKKNKDYVVKDGQIVIVDEFTGRMLHGRRYSGGLHQAIEAKEGVTVQEESVTLATITFQNYFRLYTKLAGMTGTAVTEAEEFSKIYHLEVVAIPTNRPSQRIDLQDVIYKNEEAKFEAVAKLIKEVQEKGQPVLVGTASIAKSEKLSRFLKAKKITHSVLNAKYHQKEGEIVAKAGEQGAVTIATNMAGRGVDIVLGGVPPQPDAPKAAFKEWEKKHQQILELGGLFVVGTERHESRRIDNQLRGRAGRQGDPGTTQFFVSMEDDLMRIFGGDRMKNVMQALKIPDDVAINNKLLSRTIEQAQSRVEGHNFDIRKQLVQYDDVMNKHREAIYRRRSQALLATTEEAAVALHEDILNRLSDSQQQEYEAKSKSWSPEIRSQIERTVVLRAIDVLWIEHLRNLEDLRESIGLRGYGQREPLVEYKQEAYHLFNALQDNIDSQTETMLANAEIQAAPKIEEAPSLADKASYNRSEGSVKDSLAGMKDKVGRNDPCPCGAIDPATNKVYKYKKCGLISAPHHRG
jgi:preprotein translocase subunit SecA